MSTECNLLNIERFFEYSAELQDAHTEMHNSVEALKDEVSQRKRALKKMRRTLARVKYHGSGGRLDWEAVQMEEMVTAVRTMPECFVYRKEALSDQAEMGSLNMAVKTKRIKQLLASAFSSVERLCQQIREEPLEVNKHNFEVVIGRVTLKLEYLFENAPSQRGRPRFERKKKQASTVEEIGLA